MSWRKSLAAASLVFLGLASGAVAQSGTLEQVRQRGTLQCGVSMGLCPKSCLASASALIL